MGGQQHSTYELARAVHRMYVREENEEDGKRLAQELAETLPNGTEGEVFQEIMRRRRLHLYGTAAN